MKPGFTFTNRRQELYAGVFKRSQPCIPIAAGQLLESRQVISLGDKYYVSLGAHSKNLFFLFSFIKGEPLTVEKAMMACSLLTFVINSPVVPDFTHYFRYKAYSKGKRAVEKVLVAKPDHKLPHKFRNFERAVARTGLNGKDYFGALINTAETLDVLNDVGNRDFQKERIIPCRIATDPHIAWPSSDRTWRALTAYWSGILSLVMPGRILNFWRAVEAVTSREQRYTTFKTLDSSRISPVWSRSLVIRPPGLLDYWRRVNDSALLKRQALQRRKKLIETCGTSDKALDSLFWDARGKAAHADKTSLEYDGLASFDNQIHDALLLQYLARVEIERTWI